MVDFLLFQLYAPLVSWGDIAVGEQRPSRDYPSKSAVLGIVAAALGIPRTDETMHERLAKSYGFAVAVLAMGEILNDYHTSQVPRQQRVYWTRKEEINALADKGSTILSYRQYLTDAYYKVALWQRADNVPVDLVAIKRAINAPRFSLYLGRKSCPPSLPLQACLLQDVSLREAFTRYQSDNKLAQILAGSVRYYWDTELTEQQAGMQAIARNSCRDDIASRKRWQFMPRSYCVNVME